MKVAIDTGVLGILCHDTDPMLPSLRTWLAMHLARPGAEVMVAAICDYELRRKLLHLAMRSGVAATTSLRRLDSLQASFTFLPLTDATLRRAASLWAQARHDGKPTAAPDRLDADVILAAQALEAGATVVTQNVKHLERFCGAVDWRAP